MVFSAALQRVFCEVDPEGEAVTGLIHLHNDKHVYNLTLDKMFYYMFLSESCLIKCSTYVYLSTNELHLVDKH